MAESIGGWVEPDWDQSDAHSVHYVVSHPFTPLESEGLPGEDVESWITPPDGATVVGDELDLAERLLRTFHLSVPERQRLVDGRLRLSTLVAAAARYLDETRTLPAGWRPQMPYDGVVVERRGDEFWLHERHEIGMLRYSPVRSWAAPDLTGAIRFYVERFGKDGTLDGVRIDFQS